MAQWNELAREYEARRFPLARRLDVHGEGPQTARDRALRWIQTFAHEQPGADLLLVVERARRVGAQKGAVRVAVEKMLEELNGGLIDWWAPFGDGSLAVRVSLDPQMTRAQKAAPERAAGEGRTAETAGAAYVETEDDIPQELLPIARRAAELRRTREGLGVGTSDVVMRKMWIAAQATAMSDRITWEQALREILAREERRMYEDD
ncbi:MAG TPA: hypothetical protein VFE05_22835 [Longimicrobiaceae bacterium]|nr:hypothetical protein [Longimicrobiaceae bacterium]